MGCDIHIHTEIKIKGKWEHYGNPDFPRCYILFEKLAGVRGEMSNAISEPKGLPHNVTTITKIDFQKWVDDGHSFSWFGMDEIKQLYAWWDMERREALREWDNLETYIGYLFGRKWIDNPMYKNRIVEDIRWIFWFDN